nr:PAP1 [Diospyros kaki]
MEKKPGGSFFFKRLGKKGSSRWWFRSSGLRWKKLSFQLWFVDGFLFKIVSVLEAIALVATLCFFYLCCGCHI